MEIHSEIVKHRPVHCLRGPSQLLRQIHPRRPRRSCSQAAAAAAAAAATATLLPDSGDRPSYQHGSTALLLLRWPGRSQLKILAVAEHSYLLDVLC